MFDIGWGELVLVGLVALIVIGPKELPTVLRTAGQWMGKVKRMASEFQGQFQEALREAEVADLKQQADELTNSLRDMTKVDIAEETSAEEVSSEWEPPYETPEHTEPAAETVVHDGAATAAPVAAVESASAQPDIKVPLPEPVAPVKTEDLAQVETPPPKQAGGSA
jgi:sec-independent protein translocase protein TatB